MRWLFDAVVWVWVDRVERDEQGIGVRLHGLQMLLGVYRRSAFASFDL